MKKRLLPLCAALALAVSLTPAAHAAITPASSNNSFFGDYTATAYCTPVTPITSYLYTQGDRVIRVECVNSGAMTVETYDSSFTLTDSKTLPLEEDFPYWGGFYAGEKYNFVLLGQWNSDHDDHVKSYCVVKYSKDWQKLGAATLDRADTVAPFSSGQPRFLEHGGYLYIHASREMYSGHQASSLYRVDVNAMTFENLSHLHYISHSFNQFVSMDDKGNLVLLDHGDAAPRGANLHRVDPDMDYRYPERYPDEAMVTIRSFGGSYGENNTGATLGGLARTSSGFLTALSDTNLGSAAKPGTAVHNIYLTYTPDSSFTEGGTVTKQVTSYPAGGSQSAGTPFLVPTGLSGGWLLWEVKEKGAGGVYEDSGTVAYTTYNSATGAFSGVKTAAGALSDCPPIPYQGGLLWYVTKNSVPTFYHLTTSGITAHTAAGSLAEAPVTPTQPANPITLTTQEGTTFTLSDARSEEMTRLFQIDGSTASYSVLHLAPGATVTAAGGIPWSPACYLLSGDKLTLAGFAHFDSDKTTFTQADLQEASGVRAGSGQQEFYPLGLAGLTVWGVMFDGDPYAPASTPIASALSRGEDPFRSSFSPSAPASQPAENTIPASGTAYASTQSVLVDGKAVTFQMYALKNAQGDLTNYVKLRDLAHVLNATSARFSVDYGAKTITLSTGEKYTYDATIILASGENYTPNGSEMTTPFSGDRPYTGGPQMVWLNEKRYQLTAITLTDDQGGGYNYFKLRDLGAALGFTVGWSAEQGVYITTK